MSAKRETYQVVFPSPIKPSTNIDRLDEGLQGSGLFAQYHVFPKVLTKSAAKSKAALNGREVLAFVKRSSLLNTYAITCKNVEGDQLETWANSFEKKDSNVTSVEAEHGEGNSTCKNVEGETITTRAHSLKNVEAVKDDANTYNAGAATRPHDINIVKTTALTTWDSSSSHSLSTKLDLMLLKLEKMDKEAKLYQVKLEKMDKEAKLYQGTSKRLVVINLMCLEVMMLDYFLQQQNSSRSEHAKLAHYLPVKSFTFYKLYWFYFNETIFQGNAGFDVCRMWQEKISTFQPTALQRQQPKDYSKYVEDIIGTVDAKDAACIGFKWLEKAAQNLINFGGLECSMSSGLLIEYCAFYVTYLVSGRNDTIHLMENLFLWPDEEKTRRKNMRKRDQHGHVKQMTQVKPEIAEISFPFTITASVVDRAMLFLEDIIESQEVFDEIDLKPIQTNVIWFAKMLLSLCRRTVQRAEDAQYESSNKERKNFDGGHAHLERACQQSNITLHK